jgi:hypothetical protein
MPPRLLTALLIAAGVLGPLAPRTVGAAQPPLTGRPDVVLQTQGLVAFWTVGAEGGDPRTSMGTTENLPLRERRLHAAANVEAFEIDFPSGGVRILTLQREDVQ